MSDIEDYNSDSDNSSSSNSSGEIFVKKNISKNLSKKPILEEEELEQEDQDIPEYQEDENEFLDQEVDEDLVEEEEEEEDDNDDMIDEEENYQIQEGGAKKEKEKKEKAIPAKKPTLVQNPIDFSDDEDEDEENDDHYLQKFDAELNKNYIIDYHPECSIHNYDEIAILSNIVRDSNNNIIDDLHKTLPFLTKFEKARVLGQRSKQINAGSKPFIKVPENVIDGYIIAELELQQKRIPFIIRRPLPSGGSEYWNLRDLEIIDF